MADERCDDIKRLLDNGAYVVLFRNGLRSYTTVSLKGQDAADVQEIIDRTPDDGPHITDDFEPSRSLYRLSEKSIGNIVDNRKPKEGPSAG